MHLPDDRIIYLISRSARGLLTEEEKAELEAWKTRNRENRQLAEKFMDEEYIIGRVDERSEIDVDAGFRKFLDKAGLEYPPVVSIERKKKKAVWFYLAAAIVTGILVMTYIGFTGRNAKDDASQLAAVESKQDLLPGQDKAILVLGDNTKIVLDSAGHGAIATQGDVKVVKTPNGIAYLGDKAGAQPEALLYNTLSTPRGAQYKLTLPDGSAVWLNAASSIRYPVAFTGSERRVEITGEAYFEIAKKMAPGGKGRVPFIVSANGQEVEVLGTHFNVNAYTDEAVIKTTLLEGKVKVTKGGNSVLLDPGQQALATASSIKTIQADTDLETAWKNGLFQFRKTDVKNIMRQVSRWYDVEIEYNGNPPATFSGAIPRSVNASKLFALLEATGNVHFKIENNKVIVLP